MQVGINNYHKFYLFPALNLSNRFLPEEEFTGEVKMNYSEFSSVGELRFFIINIMTFIFNGE
jgi:hypothetical protein